MTVSRRLQNISLVTIYPLKWDCEIIGNSWNAFSALAETNLVDAYNWSLGNSARYAGGAWGEALRGFPPRPAVCRRNFGGLRVLGAAELVAACTTDHLETDSLVAFCVAHDHATVSGGGGLQGVSPGAAARMVVGAKCVEGFHAG